MGDRVYAAEKIMKKRIRRNVSNEPSEPTRSDVDDTIPTDETVGDDSVDESEPPTKKPHRELRNLEKEEQPRRDTRATNGKKHKKEIVDSDGEDSSSSDDLPLSRRKDSSSTKRKAEVLSKLFPQESGKIGVTITTSPPNGSKPPKQITTSANKNSTTPSLTENPEALTCGKF
ncbi:hypothetical protein V9T40_010355 [Parthenolecanium corni]|uniref:Uncharacterized protein n=1 Tax=Parthenolecanium corni TaxID=536013 RepID=A0AAN9T8M6_9HEMI